LAGIQFHILNRSKGPAVHVSQGVVPAPGRGDLPLKLMRSLAPHLQGPRAQIDRKLYKREMQAALKNYPNLTIRTANVKESVFSPLPRFPVLYIFPVAPS